MGVYPLRSSTATAIQELSAPVPKSLRAMIISRFTLGNHAVYNIIPDEARIGGNIRSHDTASSKKLLSRVQGTAFKSLLGVYARMTEQV